MSTEYMAVKIYNDMWMEVEDKQLARRLALIHVDRLIEFAPIKRTNFFIKDWYTKEYWGEVRAYICDL